MRSDQIKKGFERAPHRSLLRATGLVDEDFEKPFIAVANSHVDIIPGHFYLAEYGRIAKDEIRKAGGVPFEFNTIGVDDGVAMGHPGMLYSLPSRELIADSIETMMNAHCLDAMVCIPNCDKIVPGDGHGRAAGGRADGLRLGRADAGRHGGRRRAARPQLGLRGGRQAGHRPDRRRRAARRRVPGLPLGRLLLGHVHRQLHERAVRGHGGGAARATAPSWRSPRSARRWCGGRPGGRWRSPPTSGSA